MVRIAQLDLPLDHVAFSTADLDEARKELHAAGLACSAVGEVRWPTPDGPHRARTLCVVFPGSYLDIIEEIGAASEMARAARPILNPNGIVLRTQEIERTRWDLMSNGVRCGRPYRIVRTFRGSGGNHSYEIFGTGERHASGLPLSVIVTRTGASMENRSAHRSDVRTASEAARLLGVELFDGPEAPHGPIS